MAETKMGALLSFVAALLAIAVSRLLGVGANWQPDAGAVHRPADEHGRSRFAAHD